MLRQVLRTFSSVPKLYTPSDKLEFDAHGLMLIYRNPSTTVTHK
jgi:hypothetical protein